MIIKKFRNQTIYNIVKIFPVIILLIIFSIIVNVVILKIDGIKLINLFHFEFFIFTLGFILIALILLFGPKNKNTYSEIILSDDNIDFLPDEKIIENKRQCTEISISIAGYNQRKRDIIVTNKRIILGNLDTLTLYSKGNLKQDMTIFNLWSNKIEKIPNLKNSKFLYNLLGANTKINDIAYGEDKIRVNSL